MSGGALHALGMFFTSQSPVLRVRKDLRFLLSQSDNIKRGNKKSLCPTLILVPSRDPTQVDSKGGCFVGAEHTSLSWIPREAQCWRPEHHPVEV